MDAMEYETLLRRVHNSGRNYSIGADADIYRPMERALRSLGIKSLNRSQDELEYEYRKAFAKVREFVQDALLTGIRKIQYSAPKEDVEELRRMSESLGIDFYDKEKLDRIIHAANGILKSHGLEMR